MRIKATVFFLGHMVKKVSQPCLELQTLTRLCHEAQDSFQVIIPGIVRYCTQVTYCKQLSVGSLTEYPAPAYGSFGAHFTRPPPALG